MVSSASMGSVRVSLILLLSILPTTCMGSVDVWDYLVYAQTWPMADCAEAIHEHHTCSIPSNVNFWTIHGLWPSQHGERDKPVNCNSTWPFDVKEIQPIMKQMNTYWPNLYTDTEKDSFWEHEWQKHGTCAANLPVTNGQLNYFTQGLKLRNTFNLDKILESGKIVPSDVFTYNLTQVNEALHSQLGKYPYVFCTMMTDPKTQEKKHIIYSIEICLNKQFIPIDCDSTYGKHHRKDNTLYYKPKSIGRDVPPQSDCPSKEGFYIPTITHL